MFEKTKKLNKLIIYKFKKHLKNKNIFFKFKFFLGNSTPSNESATCGSAATRKSGLKIL